MKLLTSSEYRVAGSEHGAGAPLSPREYHTATVFTLFPWALRAGLLLATRYPLLATT